jgi:hypothetical protein
LKQSAPRSDSRQVSARISFWMDFSWLSFSACCHIARAERECNMVRFQTDPLPFFFLPGLVPAKTFRAFSMSRSVQSRIFTVPISITGGASMVPAAMCRCSVTSVRPNFLAASRVEYFSFTLYPCIRFSVRRQNVAYCVAQSAGEWGRKMAKGREGQRYKVKEIEEKDSIRNRQVVGSTPTLGSIFLKPKALTKPQPESQQFVQHHETTFQPFPREVQQNPLAKRGCRYPA